MGHALPRPAFHLPLAEAQRTVAANRGMYMTKKTSNLKVVERQDVYKKREEREETWRLTRAEITASARAVRIHLESFRSQLEGMPFDVVTNDMPCSVQTRSDVPSVLELADGFDPCIKGRFDVLSESIPDLSGELFNMKMDIAETAFQLGVLAGPIFSGASDREIDRLERGLIHATVSRRWRCKDRG
jgi:hypothetical protein